MFTDLTQSLVLIRKSLNKQLGMPVNHCGNLTQSRSDTLGATLKSILQITEKPRAPLAAAPNHHAVHTGLLDHAHGIFGGENIAVAQDGNVWNRLAKLCDGVPVRCSRIVLGSGAPVQGYGGDTRIPGDLSGFKERDVVIINAFTHLDGQGNIVT